MDIKGHEEQNEANATRLLRSLNPLSRATPHIYVLDSHLADGQRYNPPMSAVGYISVQKYLHQCQFL